MKKFGIVGVDEVGRGPLAGPVVVTALFLKNNLRPRVKKLGGLRDSKKLPEAKRKAWSEYARGNSDISYATVRISPKIIDKINITEAANKAATRAVAELFKKNNLQIKKTKIYLDGGLFLNDLFVNGKKLTPKTETLIKGDEKINAVKLASIVAKVSRDKHMEDLHRKYPRYGFDRHKGYGTLSHSRAIRRYGLSPIHRRSFCSKFV